MRLRTFTASGMQEAMAQVRAALGPDALILSTSIDRANGKATIVAALEQKETPLPPPTASGLRAVASSADQEWLEELALLLRWHNTPEPLAGRLLYKARHLELGKLFALQKFAAEDRELLETKALSRLLSEAFRFVPPPLEQRGARLMIVGPPGIGKTVAVAKLAAQAVMDKTHVTVITTDNKRAGGVEQLAAFTDILELPLIVAESPAELAAALRPVAQGAHVLIDTCGCNPYDKNELDELTGLIGVGANPSHTFEPVLAMAAGIDSFEAADTARAFAFPAISKLFVTRVDTARRIGSVLAAADARNLSFAGISNSARVVGELKALDAGVLARLMLQYRLQSA